ncbi:MAG TPA: SAM-dependent methyltransferase [Micromonosporaceae bacterium]|nr:SAM-dependent methyltransferase [Micromonosporaceae bacterium]HCU50748.1 SAM-dependent methyltransferase [Micromonosporaceae bacterium]
MPIAAYDEIADWYAAYVDGVAAEFGVRVHQLLDILLGQPISPANLCVDIGCGTGARAEPLRELGWRPVGVDLSTGQLRHALNVLPVVAADAAALPIRTASTDAVTSILCHTDLPDYVLVVQEAARILKPGGSFVHIGVHPAFTGAFADRSDSARIIVDSTYHRRERRFDSFTPHGVRVRVGAWHTPLPELLHTAIDAGLTITGVKESSPDGGVPDMLGFKAIR